MSKDMGEIYFYSQVQSHDFPNSCYICNVSLLRITNHRLHIFGQISTLAWIIYFVFGGHLHILIIYERKAWKRQSESEKVCLLKKIYYLL